MTLRKLARRSGKTVISTIHQPSSKAYSYCDRLILLADGHCVYQGPARDVGTYFDISNKCKSKNQNPCDFFMRELSISYPKGEQDEAKIQSYLEKYNTEQANTVEMEIKEKQFGALNLKRARALAVPFTKQLSLLRYRGFIFVKREPQAVKSKFGIAIFFGLLADCIYWQIGGDYTEKGVTNIAGCNFFLLVGQLMNWMFGSILTFQLERDVFLREQANRLYSPVAYFAAKNSVETLVALITPMIQLLVLWWAIGYDLSTGADAGTFFQVYLAMALVAQVAMGVGLFISALSPNMVSATSIAPAFSMPMVLFGGFIANNDSMPDWLKWLQWISPIRYGNEAIAHTQFDDAHYLGGVPPKVYDIPQVYLALQGFTVGYWKCIIVMICFSVFWRILSLIALKLSVKKFQ